MSAVGAAAPADRRVKPTSQPGLSSPGASSTKFLPPVLPHHWVRRDRLNRLLAAAAGQAITVVTGPPGAGKSVLLADSASTTEVGRVSWLSLDPSDNDCCNFWTSIAVALGIDRETVAAMPETWRFQTAEEQAREVAKAAPTGVPAVLVLDEFHHLTDGSRLEGVMHLAHHLPPGIRLVAAGHGVPRPPGQQPWDQAGAVTLGEDDLRFTVAEVVRPSHFAHRAPPACGTGCRSHRPDPRMGRRHLPGRHGPGLEDRQIRGPTAVLPRIRPVGPPTPPLPRGSSLRRFSRAGPALRRARRFPARIHGRITHGSSGERLGPTGLHRVRIVPEAVRTSHRTRAELLGYLPSHLHLREIAARMYVSVNTVKTHLRNLYRKLGAGNRGEAVDIASSNGLL